MAAALVMWHAVTAAMSPTATLELVEASTTCIDRAALEAAVEERWGEKLFVPSAPYSIRVELDRRGERGLRVSVRLDHADRGPRGERAEIWETCDEARTFVAEILPLMLAVEQSRAPASRERRVPIVAPTSPVAVSPVGLRLGLSANLVMGAGISAGPVASGRAGVGFRLDHERRYALELRFGAGTPVRGTVNTHEGLLTPIRTSLYLTPLILDVPGGVFETAVGVTLALELIRSVGTERDVTTGTAGFADLELTYAFALWDRLDGRIGLRGSYAFVPHEYKVRDEILVASPIYTAALHWGVSWRFF